MIGSSIIGGGGMDNPMTTAGDIITGGASGTPTRLAMGSALQVLRVNAGATALEYAAAGGGSVSDAAYGSSWNGDTTTAPSKNSVYDQVELVDKRLLSIDTNTYPPIFQLGTANGIANTWGTRISDYGTNGATTLESITFECTTGTESVKYFHGVPNGGNWDLTEIGSESSVSFTVGTPHLYTFSSPVTVDPDNDVILVSLQGNGAEIRYYGGGSCLYAAATISTNQTNYALLTDSNEFALALTLSGSTVGVYQGTKLASRTTVQITSQPTEEGVLVYNSTTKKLNFWDGTAWRVVTSA